MGDFEEMILGMAGPERPTLIAVADVSVGGAPWSILPVEERHWIRLRAGMSAEEIGTLVASSAIDGAWEGEWAEELFRGNLGYDYAVLFGGVYSLAADGTVIKPGCCMGLEDWRDWPRALDWTTPTSFGHGPPEAWMSHTPSGVAIEQGNWTWGKDPEVLQRVMFSRDDFARAVERLTADIYNFALQVVDWATELSPDVGPMWAEHWLGNLDMLPGTVRD